jgi:hypothetical protein
MASASPGCRYLPQRRLCRDHFLATWHARRQRQPLAGFRTGEWHLSPIPQNRNGGHASPRPFNLSYLQISAISTQIGWPLKTKRSECISADKLKHTVLQGCVRLLGFDFRREQVLAVTSWCAHPLTLHEPIPPSSFAAASTVPCARTAPRKQGYCSRGTAILFCG